jgi:heme/copper-type cytochrome/quinol oxidase subunit 3
VDINTAKKFSKRIIMFVIISNCIAFALLLASYIIVRTEPTTLIISWFTFTGTECLALAGIKISERAKGSKTACNSTKEEDHSI